MLICIITTLRNVISIDICTGVKGDLEFEMQSRVVVTLAARLDGALSAVSVPGGAIRL